MTSFARSACGTLGLLAALLLVERAHPSHGLAFVPIAVQAQVRDLVFHGASSEDDLDLLAGYYDELLNASREAGRVHQVDELWDKTQHRAETMEQLPSFLLYRPKPSQGDPADREAPIVTNSLGMVDREYPVERTPGVRRLIWVGDSLSRGLGAPFGRALEPQVEEWLNATQTDAGVTGYEVMNLAVEGYRLSQFVKVVAEALPRYRPDVVVVGLSDLSVTRIFGYHLARLLHDGIDVEYPYLRDLAARARLRADDTPRVSETKLQPYCDEFVRWCLTEIASEVRAGGATLVAVLVPAVGEGKRLAERFASSRAIVRELAIPTIDLVATFDDVDDLEAVRVSPIDHHPNEAGYALLLTRMQAELRQAPATFAIVLGHAPTGAQ